jgi:hypothetical protein
MRAPVGTLRRKRTATSTMQCIYSGVSKASLQKTGVLLNSAGDFREFLAEKVRKRRNWRLSTIRKACHWQAFLLLEKEIL